MCHTKKMLHPARTLPLPDRSADMARKVGYRHHPIDLTHPLHKEDWVDLRTMGLRGRNAYHTDSLPPYYQKIEGSIPELFARKTIAEKLLRVDAGLKPYGLALYIHDAWRPLAVQNYFHDVWMPAFLKIDNPELDGEALLQEVEKYWARGAADGKVDPLSPPPHYTGAAIDLTLCHQSGEPAYMGSLFDDVTLRAATDFYEHTILARSFSDLEARANRRVLFHAMTAEGFNNLPTEWWHFSYGDQMWARMTGQDAAFYGPLSPR